MEKILEFSSHSDAGVAEGLTQWLQYLAPVHTDGNVHTFAWEDAPTAAPLADLRAVQAIGRASGQRLDRMFMHPAAYRRIMWWSVQASVAHLPRRTRKRLLARVRAAGKGR